MSDDFYRRLDERTAIGPGVRKILENSLEYADCTHPEPTRFDTEKRIFKDAEAAAVFYANQAKQCENNPEIHEVFQASCETAEFLLRLHKIDGEWFDATKDKPKHLDVVLTEENGYYEVAVFRDGVSPMYTTHRGLYVRPSYWRKLPRREKE